MTTTFKKGQRVRWEDPQNEKSGEYDVLDLQDEPNAGKPENERIIRIGNREKTWDIPAEYLTIVCPISDVDREQLATQEHRNRIRGKELMEQMQEIVSRFDDGEFSVEGYSVQVCDEGYAPCCVYGFSVKDGKLYAMLDYDSGDLREVPVENLHVWSLFEAFCELIEEI